MHADQKANCASLVSYLSCRKKSNESWKRGSERKVPFRITFRNTATKWLRITFSDTHRPVPWSAIIQEVSSCTRWELILRPTTGQCAEKKEVSEHSVQNRMPPLNPSPQDLGSYVEEEVGRLESQKTPRKWCLSETTGLMHKWTHRDCWWATHVLCLTCHLSSCK